METETSDFEKELTKAINRHSMENGSDTPDWILANFLKECLQSWDKAVKLREKYYGREKSEFSS